MVRTFTILRNAVKLKVQSLDLEFIENDEGRDIFDRFVDDSRKKAHWHDIVALGYPL